ncbi:MAG: hypothetical protein QXG10_03190 [Candidatus Hadarchaeales archaeon]
MRTDSLGKDSRSCAGSRNVAGTVPTFICYLVMAVKAVPNVERALFFAADQLEGSLGDYLRRKLYGATLSYGASTEEVVHEIGEEWHEPCPELRRSLHLILSSVSESSHSSRDRSLSMALSAAIEGSRSRAREFASRVHQPVLLIYTLGVLLPMVLAVMVPVLYMTGASLGSPAVVMVSCATPVLVYFVARRVLADRPSFFNLVDIKRDEFDPKRAVTVSLISSAPPLIAVLVKADTYLFMLSLLWAPALFLSLAIYCSYRVPFRLWEKSCRMESELPQALLSVGNRMAEGRPAEESVLRAARICSEPGLRAMFTEIAAKVRLGGMSFRAAVLGENGALKSVHSGVVRGAMRAMVDLVEKSSGAAGESMIYISEHVGKLNEAYADMRKTMCEIVSSMRSVATIFAPMIAGVTSSIFKLLFEKEAFSIFGQASFPPHLFCVAMGVYSLLLSSVLSWFSAEIMYGNQSPPKYISIALSLPLSLLIFTVSFVFGGHLMSKLIA